MSKSWLHLFSSNIRPLYEQDVIDLLAAPTGTLYRFRYERKYLGDAGYTAAESTETVDATNDAADTTRAGEHAESLFQRWQGNRLVGIDLVTYYSIQQPEGYHPAAFIPIRFGRVRETGTDGSICYVDFEVGDYAPISPSERVDEILLDKRRHGDADQQIPYGDDWRKRAIRRFSEKVKQELDQHPDDLPSGRSAVIGPDPAEFAGSQPPDSATEKTLSWGVFRSSSPAAWQLVVEALARTLTFRDELMLRFVGLCCDSDGNSVDVSEDGVFAIRSGRTYQLRFSHYHPSLPGGLMYYDVDTDSEILQVVGSNHLPIGSRYDTKAVDLHAPHVESTRETVVSLEPSNPFEGAALRLRVRVERDASRTAAIAIGTASALILVALPGVLQDAVPPGVAVSFAVAGAGIAAGLAALGLRRG